MAATVTQYQATQKGGPFALVSIAKPIPEPNNVSIRIKAVALNPLEWKQLYFGAMVESWPAMFGVDGAGVVEAVGEKVTKFKAGDEVFSFCSGGSRGAAYQEVATVPEMFVAMKPGNVSFEEAASLPLCYCTAAAAVYAALRIPLPFLPNGSTTGTQPDSILVLGGSSGVGASAIQILRLVLPSAMILVTSSPQHHTRLTSLGATQAFDQNSPTLIEDIRSTTPEGKGVNFIIDTVGSGASQTSIFDTLSAGGPREYAEVVTGKQIQVPEDVKRHQVFGRALFGAPEGGSVMPALAELVRQGKFKVPLQIKNVGTGFEAIAKGLEELKGGVSGTKLVVSI